MSEHRINCEAFRLRTGAVKSIDIDRGFGVIHVDDLPEGRRIFLDPKVQPQLGYPYDRTTREESFMALDLKNPPQMSRRMIHSFSIDAWYLNPATSGDNDYITPINVYEPVEKPIGRAAVVSLIEYSEQSARSGNAYILNQSDNTIALRELSVVDPELGIVGGVSVVLLPEGGSLAFRREALVDNPDRPAFNRQITTDYSLRYEPDSHSGLLLKPFFEAQGPGPRKDPEGPGGDESGDREPKNPRRPINSGSIALDEPHPEEVIWSRAQEA